MNATVVAVAGILGTLLAPTLTELVRRRSALKDHLYAQRLDLYVELLEMTTQASFAMIGCLDGDDVGLDVNRLEQVIARTRVLAGVHVKRLSEEYWWALSEFYMRLGLARETSPLPPDHVKVMDLIYSETCRLGNRIEAQVRKFVETGR